MYQADFNPEWISEINILINSMIDFFYDPVAGFFDTSSEHQSLLFRPRNNLDNVTPSGSSMAVYSLLLQAAYTGNQEFLKIAEKCFKETLPKISETNPIGYSFWLKSLVFAQSAKKQVVITWPNNSLPDEEILEIVNRRYIPNLVLAASPFPSIVDLPLLFQDRSPVAEKTTAFVCEGFVCQKPVTSGDDFSKLLYVI